MGVRGRAAFDRVRLARVQVLCGLGGERRAHAAVRPWDLDGSGPQRSNHGSRQPFTDEATPCSNSSCHGLRLTGFYAQRTVSRVGGGAFRCVHLKVGLEARHQGKRLKQKCEFLQTPDTLALGLAAAKTRPDTWA